MNAIKAAKIITGEQNANLINELHRVSEILNHDAGSIVKKIGRHKQERTINQTQSMIETSPIVLTILIGFGFNSDTLFPS
jgi:hypothetical protein